MNIGIFGGSFNPIHCGHVALAKAVRRQCSLHEVWLMVSPHNPLKQQSELLPDHLRFQLAQEAVRGEVGIRACDYEMHLPKPSYTWNTLQHLSHDYPEHTFVLVIGGDNWAAFQRWYRWKDILRNYRVVVYPRDPFPGTISVPLLPVSSTDIRQRVRQHRPLTGLVPATIEPLVLRYYR